MLCFFESTHFARQEYNTLPYIDGDVSQPEIALVHKGRAHSGRDAPVFERDLDGARLGLGAACAGRRRAENGEGHKGVSTHEPTLPQGNRAAYFGAFANRHAASAASTSATAARALPSRRFCFHSLKPAFNSDAAPANSRLVAAIVAVSDADNIGL